MEICEVGDSLSYQGGQESTAVTSSDDHWDITATIRNTGITLWCSGWTMDFAGEIGVQIR